MIILKTRIFNNKRSLLYTIFFTIVFFVLNTAMGGYNYPRDIMFSGYKWEVKGSGEKIPPHDNYFNASARNVWVDLSGRLHLRIVKRKDRWLCSEVISLKSFGYGRYIFYVDSDVAELDKNVIAGFFTWDTAPDYSHREIDIEFGTWGGQLRGFNAQYVVQHNFIREKNLFRFLIEKNKGPTVHMFEWLPGKIFFHSNYGKKLSFERGDIIAEWSYKGNNIQRPGNEKVRINLYLYKALPPANGENAEIIIRRFKFDRLK